MRTVRIERARGHVARNLYHVNTGSPIDTEIWSACNECGQMVAVARPHYRTNWFSPWAVTEAVLNPGATLGLYTVCFCEECADDLITAGEIVRCNRCGTLTDDWESIDGCGDYCEDCRNETATRCDCCGRWTRDASEVSDVAEWWCDECLDEHAHYCNHCDNYVTGDNWNYSAGMCDNCAEEMDRIPDYHSARNNGFETFGSEPYIGRELEVEKAHSATPCGAMARAVCDLMNDIGERVQVEHDGSLRNGFEMVFSPHAVESWNKDLFASALDRLQEAGYRSHDPGTCGYHVHLSRLWFGSDVKRQARNIAHFVNAFNANYDTLVRIARRTTETAEQWARRNDTGRYGDRYTGSPAVKYCKSKKAGRYQAVNLDNPHTVEIRLCRGSLKREALEAWDDLIITMARNCERVKYGVVDFEQWTAGITEQTARYVASRTGINLEV